MIFTLGKASSYDRSFEDGELNFKIGRMHHDPADPNYPGGTVWQFRENAELCALEAPGFKVYGVMASWFTDTVPSRCVSPGARDLLCDSLLVQLKGYK